MSEYITGIVTNAGTAEQAESGVSGDNGRLMIGWTREKLTEYLDGCASGKRYIAAKMETVAES